MRVASLRHQVGTAAVLAADAPSGRYSAVFEDDGETGYFYGLDHAQEQTRETPIVDALHIYSVVGVVDQDASYPIEIRWAEDRNRAGLFIEGKCHAVFDFDEKRAVCRDGFPPATSGFTASHDWDKRLAQGL